MKKYIFVLLLFAFALTACSGEEYPAGTPTATPNEGQIALQMLQDKVASEGTQAAVDLIFTATAQIAGMTATQQAFTTQAAITEQARVDAQATSDQARVDAQATSDQARRDGAATQQRKDDDAATQQANIDAESTAAQGRIDAASTSTQSAISTASVITQTALPPIQTATQLGLNNQIAIDAKNLEAAELDLQQKRDTNKISWQIPLLVALVVLGAGVLWVVRKSRWNSVIDDNGELAGFGFDEKFVRPHALPGAVLDLKAKALPLLTDAATIKELLINEQKIRAIAAMPVNPSSSGAQAFNMAFSEVKKEDPFEIVDSVPEHLLDSEAMKAADNDWRKANE
jgi:hypothetical protein